MDKFKNETRAAASRARWGDESRIVVNVCEVCGKSFVGKKPYDKRKACDDPACRLAIRSRASKEAARKNSAKKATRERNCLGWCGKKFRPVNGEHFCAACRQVKRSREEGFGAEYWGTVI